MKRRAANNEAVKVEKNIPEHLLLRAAFDGDLELLKQEYAKATDPLAILENDYNVFHIACIEGKLNIAQYLYQQNQGFSKSLPTAFFEACRKGHLEVAQWVYSLDKIACIQARNPQGINCMVAASRNGRINIAEWLLEIDNTLIESQDNNGNNIFISAVVKGEVAMGKWILKKKPELLTSENTKGDNAAAAAWKYKMDNSILMLLSYGLSMKIGNGCVLDKACEYGELLQALNGCMKLYIIASISDIKNQEVVGYMAFFELNGFEWFMCEKRIKLVQPAGEYFDIIFQRVAKEMYPNLQFTGATDGWLGKIKAYEYIKAVSIFIAGCATRAYSACISPFVEVKRDLVDQLITLLYDALSTRQSDFGDQLNIQQRAIMIKAVSQVYILVGEMNAQVNINEAVSTEINRVLDSFKPKNTYSQLL